jgi:sec-independent protein translocase protein TatB
VVALIAIGPKDLPVAIKTVAELVKKARRMAGEFQTHVDEMVREANLHEVRDTFNDIRRMDIKGKILDAVDGDGTLRKTIADNPMDINPAPPPVPVHDAAPVAESAVEALPEHAMTGPIEEPPARRELGPPSFIPPSIAAAGIPAPPPPPPAFVPPAIVAEAASARRVSHYV